MLKTIETQNKKKYDLADRTLAFTKKVIELINNTPKTIPNIEIAKQLTRSSGSIGANYLEAEEALSRKDFLLRIKICKKESKETKYWLCLIKVNQYQGTEKDSLTKEAIELMKIFGAIIEKSK